MENLGERQLADKRDWGYFAHLSIYVFGACYTRNMRVLDIGCGTGYGLHCFLSSGAKTVSAIERDQELVSKLVKEIPDANILACDLEKGSLPFSENTLDLVFSSNVLEHIINCDAVLDECHRVLAPDGRLILGVPPIATIGELRENAKNIFHVNNLSEEVWNSKLFRYFRQVNAYTHWVVSNKIISGTISRDNPSLDDFIFTKRVPGEQTITSLFVCEAPRESILPSSIEVRMPPEWRKEQVEAAARIEIFTSLIRERDEIRRYWQQEIERLRNYVEENLNSGDPDTLRNVLDHLKNYRFED